MTPTDAPDDAASPDAAPDSALVALRAQRDAAKAQLAQLHIKVPRMDLWGAYRPVDPGVVEEAIERRRRRAKTDAARQQATLLANADVLVAHCDGLYRLDADGREVGLDPRKAGWTQYGAALGTALGYDPGDTPVSACVGLFATAADLMTHATQLAIASGYDTAEAEVRYRGE